ncbi:hypothetical protein AGRA3207_002165 [Actinomadura graeca]|uniref:Uncharacterized protein n=1 Tax=Actinomadura graeca TaxID=2750812 RepID=A0ABX8QR97_9ACTN|nr:hypothetical protein [Actinomadura graeca]QXJ21325.1 hypothetical protein AGRA3207_002165 [Actinomadura graeca]
MANRSATKPILLGIGTAAVLAAGSGSAIAYGSASPSTSPSPTITPAPTSTSTAPPADPPGKLIVSVDPVDSDVTLGERVQVNTHVSAKGGTVTGVKVLGIQVNNTKAVLGGECKKPFTMSACTVGTLKDGERDTVISTLLVPESVKKKLTVTLTVTVGATGTKSLPVPAKVTYKPKPKPTPTLSPGKGEGPSDGKSGKDKGGSGSGGSGGGTGGSGSGGTGGTGGGGPAANPGGYVPPAPNSSFDPKNPQVALPPIAAPNPSVAPSPQPAAPASRLRNNKSPVAQELTFDRMASTQIAWLAALMVAFFLLMTQLRLGRRDAPRSAAAARARRVKGTHRRARRGTFAK